MRRTPDFIKSYPDEDLLEEIRRVAGLVGKPVLTRTDFTRHSGISASTLSRRFGGWRDALERAGVGHMHSGEAEEAKLIARAKYSEEELAERIRQVAQVVDKPILTVDAFRRHTGICLSTIRKRFGNWRSALEQAGVGHMFYCTPEHRSIASVRRRSDEAMLEEIRRVAALVKKPMLTCKDFRSHSKIALRTFARRFGNWGATLERAGVGHLYSGGSTEALKRYPRLVYTDEDLLEEIRRVAGLVGKPLLTRDDFERHSKIDKTTPRDRFGSWRAALERAGVGHMYDAHSSRPRYSEEELLEEMRRVARLVGKPMLTRVDFDKYSKFCSATLKERFGGWQAALERAGLGHLYFEPVWKPNGGYSDEELLKEVQRVAALIGKPVLTMADFRRHSKIGANTVRRRFGGWRKTLERAGLERMDFQSVVALVAGYPDDVMLEEVRRVAGLVGKPVLTHDEFANHARIHPATIARRFGGWRAAFERAGVGHRYYRNVEGANRKYSDEELLSEVRRVAGIVGKPTLTRLDFKTHSKLDLKNITERFGGWKDVLERTGLGHMRSRRLVGYGSAEDVIDLIRRFCAKTDPNDFTLNNLVATTGIIRDAIKHHFGSWKNAVLAAGLPYHRGPLPYSEEKCLANIANLWAHYGRPPKYKELDGPLSSVSATVYSKRWGNLCQAFETFLEWVEREQSESQLNPEAVPVAQQGVVEPEDSELAPALKFRVMRRDGFQCVICGRGPAGVNGVELYVEHIVPPSAGGKTVLGNLQTLCNRCGSAKPARDCDARPSITPAITETQRARGAF